MYLDVFDSIRSRARKRGATASSASMSSRTRWAPSMQGSTSSKTTSRSCRARRNLRCSLRRRMRGRRKSSLRRCRCLRQPRWCLRQPLLRYQQRSHPARRGSSQQQHPLSLPDHLVGPVVPPSKPMSDVYLDVYPTSVNTVYYAVFEVYSERVMCI